MRLVGHHGPAAPVPVVRSGGVPMTTARMHGPLLFTRNRGRLLTKYRVTLFPLRGWAITLEVTGVQR